MTRRRLNVLLVEDNPGDVFLVRLALARMGKPVTIHMAEDGEAGMAFLRGEPPYTGVPRPDFVMLDLNLPKKSGREVRAEMRSDPRFRSIPVVVMTGSGADDDVHGAYSAGANIYMIKPNDPDTLIRMVQVLEELWFVLGRIPTV
jgi:CheY-like chemotaxis protein